MNKTELINKICDSYCKRNRPESMNTDWGQSLLAYGFMQAYLKTGNKAAYNYLKKWLGYHLANGINPNYFVGSWSIGLLYPDITTLFPEYENELNFVAENLYSFILDKSLRNGAGIILHNVDLPHIYIDTLYYSVVPLAKLGDYLGDDEWVEEAFFQLASHLALLKDKDSDFYIHCEQNLSGVRSEGAWGRGNGWVLMTYAELLKYLPKQNIINNSPEKLLKNTTKNTTKNSKLNKGKKSELEQTVLELLNEFIQKLLPLQTKNGLWRTILNDKSSYEETSATAMILYALQAAARNDIFTDEKKIIEKCHKGLGKYLDKNYILNGTSEGTWPGNIEYYKSLDTGEWWWGVGAYLLALCNSNS